jgi:phosphatidate cytidylyltransferase
MATKQTDKPGRNLSELAKRVISSIVLLALAITLIWLQGLYLMFLIVLLAGVAWHELHSIAWVAGYRPWYLAGMGLTLLLALRGYLVSGDLLSGKIYTEPGTGVGLIDIVFVFLLVLARLGLSAIRTPFYGDKIAQNPAEYKREYPPPAERRPLNWMDLGITLAGALYIGGLLGYGPLTMGMQETVARADGIAWAFLILFGTAANDIGAFVIGKFLAPRGKDGMPMHPMASGISPKKSWEGFVGGLVFTIVVAMLFADLIKMPLLLAALLGLIICVAATVGDLSESMIKRAARIKDSSNLIPGHGGLLDRIDGLLFVIAATYWFIQLST